jgi:hypothetical protein
MSVRTRTLPLVALPLLLAVTASTAQQLDLQSPRPETSSDRHGPAREASRSRAHAAEPDLYPHRPAVPYQPGFIESLSKETATGRAGIAGWTSPNTSVGARGAADPENPGWPSVGFAIEWGGSPKRTMTP